MGRLDGSTAPHRRSEGGAILVAGLGFGDCGKGGIVDFLARRAALEGPVSVPTAKPFGEAGSGPHAARRSGASVLVVRYNGGPQAGHNVVTADGRHHTFSQFGSGTFVPGARTLLSRFMLIEPYAMFREAEHLRAVGVADALDRLTIDARCPVITPAQQAANRLRELARGPGAHGTCGQGVGETVADLLDFPLGSLRAAELGDRPAVARKLRAIRDRKMDELGAAVADLRRHPRAKAPIETLLDCSWIDTAVDNYTELARRAVVADEAAVARLLRSSRSLVFEGAQGVLLDEDLGFHPHTTWGTTTFANADAVLDEAGFAGSRTRLGVMRSYSTRHGPGPLVSEDAGLTGRLAEPHNDASGWQGPFRAGPFDAVATRYSLEAAGPVDALAVTHLDRLGQLPRAVCAAYRVADECAGVPDDLRDWLDLRGGRIVGLRARRPPDLIHQERLTRLLGGCLPVLTPLAAGGPEAFVEWIETELRTPVAIASFGPTAHSKRVLPGGAGFLPA